MVIEASRPKRVCQPRLQRSGHSGKEGANWSGSQGGKTPGRTAAPSFLGAEVNHWPGMSQSAPLWPIHT